MHGLIGAAHKVVALNLKKKIDAEAVAFEEICKFPYPMQLMLVKEACAVTDRLAKGKGAPGLTSLNCCCTFRIRYLLPCKHIFHEHTYGTNQLLTAEA